VQLEYGRSQIFRIPARYLHRVRQRATRVRVTYQPATERVLDLVRVAEPAAPAPASTEPL
jgi:hypothetical protein